MANQISQQSDPKGRAVASLVLGIISVIPLLILFVRGEAILATAFGIGMIIDYLLGGELGIGAAYIGMGIVLFLPPFLGLMGLILGKKGLKSTKRNFAIVGIVLSALGMLAPLYYFIF